MILKNSKFKIEISLDNAYIIGASDNKKYDIELNPAGFSDTSDHFYKVLSIAIQSESNNLLIALIGSYYTELDHCAILEGNILTVLQNDWITQLDVTNGSVIRTNKLSSIGCNFSIYKVDHGYLIYGELDITMLDQDLNEKWTFSGNDIFVSPSGKESFRICENSIKLYDFNDTYYEIDFNGKLLKEIKAK